jgi:hypothetical protein
VLAASKDAPTWVWCKAVAGSMRGKGRELEGRAWRGRSVGRLVCSCGPQSIRWNSFAGVESGEVEIVRSHDEEHGLKVFLCQADTVGCLIEHHRYPIRKPLVF